MRFHVGDIVIGNQKASRYHITTTNVTCQVLQVDPVLQRIYVKTIDGRSPGSQFHVNPICFDLVQAYGDPEQNDADWNAIMCM